MRGASPTGVSAGTRDRLLGSTEWFVLPSIA